MALSVLIVEDDRNIAELLQLYLEKEGYAPALAADGGEAVEQFRKLQPDLVLLDVMMPVMDGWAGCKAIRAEGNTPVIMLTAKSETDEYFEYVIRISTPEEENMTAVTTQAI